MKAIQNYKGVSMRISKLRHIMSRNAITLALHWLAHGDSSRCSATYNEIAKSTRLNPDTVKSHLRDMEKEGTIAVFYINRHPRSREIVILDHLEAAGDFWSLTVEHEGVLSEHSSPALPAFNAIWNDLGGRDAYLCRRRIESRAEAFFSF